MVESSNFWSSLFSNEAFPHLRNTNTDHTTNPDPNPNLCTSLDYNVVEAGMNDFWSKNM